LSELNNALVTKADISDISKAVTEVISTVDCKHDIEDIRKQIASKVMSK
jgi:hypothetical protein